MIGTGVGYLYNRLDIGVPFGQQFASFLGLSQDLTFFTLNVNAFTSTLLAGIVGLGLSEAAYMAEIARAGILSVDKRQAEAAAALGMSRSQSTRRVVLPQAMRVIVPPTGNEAIAMVKDTSLLSAIPIITELFYQTSAIGTRTFSDHAGLRGGDGVVPHHRLDHDDRPVLPREVLRPRLRHPRPHKRFARPAGAGGA